MLIQEALDTFDKRLNEIYANLKPLLIDLANLSSDAHVKSWHRSFNKNGKKRNGTVFSKCDCIQGNIRDVFMKYEPEVLKNGRR